MSILTQDLRAAGFGGVLDKVEAAEKAVGNLLAPGGLTTENATAAAEASAQATAAVGQAAQQVAANPVGTGVILAADALNFLGPLIVGALSKKAASTSGNVSISQVANLGADIQALIAKL